MSSVMSVKQGGPRRSYITLYPFNTGIFWYQTTTNGLVLGEPPNLFPAEGATVENCPKGRFLYENGKKLFPTVHVGISTYMVGVYDPVTFIKGYIDPNSKLFSPMHQDKPSTALPVTENNAITFGVNPENGEFDQGPGVFTLANSQFGANVDVGGAVTVDGNVDVGGAMVVDGNGTFRSDMRVDGNGSVGGNVGVSGAIVVDGNGTFHSNVLVDGIMNAGEVQQEGFRLVPTGSVISFIATAAPGGWLLCDGSAVNRTTYSRLYGVIGTTYGSGDTMTTFNLPDLRGRVPLGVGSGPGLTSRSLNNSGGEETHQLSISEMPNHDHSYGDTYRTGNQDVIGIGESSAADQGSTTEAKTTGTTGGGGAHNNMQPFLVLNFIIKY